MSKFGKNIKKIRKVKKMSQTAFAEAFDLTRASVGAYEEERAEPRIDAIIAVAKEFSIPLEDLLTKDLTVNDIYNFDIFKEDLFTDEKNKKSFIGTNVTVPFLTRDRYGDYLQHMNDPGFPDKLPFISIPFPKSGIQMAFEHDSGDMMFNERGLYQGDIVFCTKLGENFAEQVINGNVYLLVTEGSIFLRRVMVRRHLLLLYPDNPNYETIELPVEKIRQLWFPKVKMSKHVSQIENTSMVVSTFESRILALEEKLKDLKK